jgi:hypothetical protein
MKHETLEETNNYIIKNKKINEQYDINNIMKKMKETTRTKKNNINMSREEIRLLKPLQLFIND